jgi:Outer membrane protein beta-barrel domain
VKLAGLTGVAVLAMAMAPFATAQDPRVEIGGSAGWTFSDGVTFDGVLAGNGNIYNSIEPKDAFSYNLNLGFFATPNVEIGFLFSQQRSKLEVGGTTALEIGDQNVDNYHGYIAFNGGDSGARVRPYILVGAGVTRYGGVDFTFNNQARNIGGQSKFSPTLGVGLKLYSEGAVGLRLGARWTPTYIKTDSEGWWCDPFWGCYVVGDSQDSNQFELSGGLVIRF